MPKSQAKTTLPKVYPPQRTAKNGRMKIIMGTRIIKRAHKNKINRLFLKPLLFFGYDKLFNTKIITRIPLKNKNNEKIPLSSGIGSTITKKLHL